jgi:hypothetical protein
MTDIALNLVAAGIGFVIAQIVHWTRATLRRRNRRWFWEYHLYKRITILVGSLKEKDFGGEIEPSMNIVDGITLGEVRTFLAENFSEVLVVTDESGIDWESPVVSLGGPLANAMTARLGRSGKLPVWFKGLPYGHGSVREIEGNGISFRSLFDEGSGRLKQDVGFVAKVSSEKSRDVPLFVLASNYGAGNHGVARVITSDKGLGALRKRVGTNRRFQAVVQSTISGNVSVSSNVAAMLEAT